MRGGRERPLGVNPVRGRRAALRIVDLPGGRSADTRACGRGPPVGPASPGRRTCLPATNDPSALGVTAQNSREGKGRVSGVRTAEMHDYLKSRTCNLRSNLVAQSEPSASRNGKISFSHLAVKT